MHLGYQRRSTVRFCRQFPRTARLGNWFLVLLGCASRRHLRNAHASFNIAVLAIMGPRYRNQRSNRLTKASQGDGKKIKHNKSLKNKVRDVQRLLKKSDLPATVRVVQERMLDVLKETIKDKAKEDKQRRIEKRSKKVKFFEKKKIFRRFKSCMKELSDAEDIETRNSALKELEEIKQQWNYVQHFPENTKYISLFPLTSHTNAEIVAKQEKIQETIAKKVEAGELVDASSTIWKMGKASQRAKKEKPNVVLSDEEFGRAATKRGSEDESGDQELPLKVNHEEDDFFMDSSPSPVKKEVKKEKKKKSSKKLKRSQFKIEKK